MLKELFSSDIGLLSMFTIGFVLVMAVYMVGFYKSQAEKDSKQAK